MRTSIKIFLLSLLFSTISFSQPSWTIKVPEGYLNDFFVGKGASSNSKSEAYQAAFENAIISILRNNTVTANYSEKNVTLSKQTQTNNEITNEIVRESAQELNIQGESKIIIGLKEVETFYEKNNGMLEAWVLISFPKKNPIAPPSKFSAIWRSVLLPGWGQFYKDDTFKGFSFMTLTLGSVASGFVFNELSKEATNNALSSRTQARRDFFNDQATQFNTISTISFISAIVFYAWNIVDATIVKQDNLYVNLESGVNENRVMLSLRF